MLSRRLHGRPRHGRGCTFCLRGLRDISGLWETPQQRGPDRRYLVREVTESKIFSSHLVLLRPNLADTHEEGACAGSIRPGEDHGEAGDDLDHHVLLRLTGGLRHRLAQLSQAGVELLNGLSGHVRLNTKVGHG